MIGPKVRKDQSMVPMDASMAKSKSSPRPTKATNEEEVGVGSDDDAAVAADDKAGDVQETGPVPCAYGPKYEGGVNCHRILGIPRL